MQRKVNKARNFIKKQLMRNKKIKDDCSIPESRTAPAHGHSVKACATDGHRHDHGEKVRGKLLAIFLLTAAYTLVEAVGGWLTGSLALLADAGHMAVDALALGLALFANWIAARPATREKTFGYFRFETLMAFINASTLLLISVSIFYESASRLIYPVPVEGGGMTLIAAGGLLVNLVSIRILHGHHDHDLNSRGAWLHLLGDTLGSVGAIAAGVMISIFGWYRADPLVSILIGGFIVYNSWSLLKKAAHVLLEGAPAHLSFSKIEQSILETEGVQEIHDLHLWEISSGREALSCHVVHRESISPDELLAQLHDRLRRQFGIEHLTFQIESPDSRDPLHRFCREASRNCFGSRVDK